MGVCKRIYNLKTYCVSNFSDRSHILGVNMTAILQIDIEKFKMSQKIIVNLKIKNECVLLIASVLYHQRKVCMSVAKRPSSFSSVLKILLQYFNNC